MSKTIEQWVFLGVGGVARALIEILHKEKPDWLVRNKVLLIEPMDIKEISTLRLFPALEKIHEERFESKDKSCIWLKTAITEKNYLEILEKEVHENAFIVNLSTRIGTLDILLFAEKKGALYIDTALDWWDDPVTDLDRGYQDSLTLLEQSILQKTRHVRNSMVYTYGMNPGIVSSMALVGLEKVVKILDPSLESLIALKQYHLVAERLGLTTIQIVERDTQYPEKTLTRNCYYNTWSPTGFIDEAFDSCAYTMGTHENFVPQNVDKEHREESLQIFFPCPSIDVIAKSYEPCGGEVHGRIIPHQEAHSLARYLKNGDYWPSVYYCYEPSDSGKELLEAARKDRDIPTRFLSAKEIAGGYDSIGCLMYFRTPEGLRTFWIGSVVENSDSISSDVNATLTQVGSGVYAAISYLIENPHLGLISPEEIDPHYALNLVTPYLGRCDFIETTALYKPEGDTLYDLMVVPNKNLLSWEKVVVKEAQLV